MELEEIWEMTNIWIVKQGKQLMQLDLDKDHHQDGFRIWLMTTT